MVVGLVPGSIFLLRPEAVRAKVLSHSFAWQTMIIQLGDIQTSDDCLADMAWAKRVYARYPDIPLWLEWIAANEVEMVVHRRLVYYLSPRRGGSLYVVWFEIPEATAGAHLLFRFPELRDRIVDRMVPW